MSNYQKILKKIFLLSSNLHDKSLPNSKGKGKQFQRTDQIIGFISIVNVAQLLEVTQKGKEKKKKKRNA